MTAGEDSPRFTKFWIAATASSFGTAVTDVAVPLLAVFTFHATALQISALLAIEQVWWRHGVGPMPAGRLYRRPRRRMPRLARLG